MPKSPFPPFPLTTLPRSFDPGDWTKIKAAFDALDARGVKSPKEMESWLLAFSELAAALSQEEARRYIAMTRRTDDRKIEKSYLDFQRDILPKAKPRWDALKRRCLSLPARRKLPKRRYAVLDRQIENEVAIYRKANVPLETREAELAQRYSKIMGAMTVAYDGKERTLQQMARYGELLDPRVRKEAWTLVAGRYLKDRDAVDGIFDDLVKIRDTMGRNAGFPDYRDYALRLRQRFDYGTKECVLHRVRDLDDRRAAGLAERAQGPAQGAQALPRGARAGRLAPAARALRGGRLPLRLRREDARAAREGGGGGNRPADVTPD